MTERELLEEISSDIKKLLGVVATQGMSDEKKIITLQKMKFNSSQISEMTGIPEPTVRKKWISKGKK
jgi:DNA-directed RNA polymerase specialized sigma24 family protein